MTGKSGQDVSNMLLETLGLAALAAVILWFGIDALLHASDQEKRSTWPSVDGRVIASRIESCRINRSKSGLVTAISYEFHVGSARYRGVERISGCAEKAVAEYDLGQYPAGKSLRIHFDPEYPAASTLSVRADTAKYYVGFGIALLMALLPMGIAVFRLRAFLAARG